MARNGSRAAALLALSAGVYALVVRPRMLRWGALGDEVRPPYPGADVIPGGQRGATMAVTIDAPPSRVWPWLVQMGCDRAGWYSWDRLDNGGVPSAERIHPEWQTVRVGQRLASTPSGRAWFEIAALDPERFLGLRATINLRDGRPFNPAGPRPRFYVDALWGFQLKEWPAGVPGWWSAAMPRPGRGWRRRSSTCSSGSPRTGSCRRASSRTSSAAWSLARPGPPPTEPTQS